VAEYRLEYRGTLFPVRGGEVTLGRSSYASVVVNNPRASREHAVVRPAAGRLEVVDLGSRNGTFVNGKRVVSICALQVGDRIKIGTEVLQVCSASTQDPQDLRVATLPGFASSASGEGETTANLDRSLDLAESLLGACTTDEPRQVTAASVVQILEDFLAEIGDGTLEGADLRRVRSIVRSMAGWQVGSGVEEQRKRIEARLGSGSSRPPA
jgi:pSer/pThr/pTyr-binding forkhead associated (FHA) protein